MSHSSKNFDNLIKKIQKDGFVVQNNGKCIKIYPPIGYSGMYIAHYGEKGFFPVRKYIKSLGF